jgi:hypothetical protein
MKVGDLVRVKFPFEPDSIGIFMGITDNSIHADLRRALVFWEGEPTCLPLRQLEAVNEAG